jgi:osmotically-inducible protein OsmY
MQYRFISWPAVSIAGLLIFSVPTPGMGQSRGTSSEGADSSYLSGSAASGHHGTSGSTDASRHEPEPMFYQSIPMSEREPVSQSPFAQNFSPDEFLTQAERDLVERVAVNVAIDPATSRIGREVTISVDQETVTLRGPVPTERARERLLNKVTGIPGVVRVRDDLRITGTSTGEPSDRTAMDLRTRTGVAVMPVLPIDQAALAEERRLAGYGGFPATQSKGVEAADDEALTGSGQMHEEDRTGTTGPSGSRTTSPMDTGAVDGTGRVTKGYGDYAVTTNDRSLVSQVRMALIGNPEFQATEETIHLKADNGVVHLHGWVSSEQERQAMAATVRDVSGVQEVVNHLQVRSATIGTVR